MKKKDLVNIDKLLKDVKNGNMSGVYKITRISDGKVYIGQSVCIRQRLEQHILNEKVEEGSESIDSAIKKDGPGKFRYETVLAIPDLTTEQLWYLEAQEIERYDAYNKGFNKTRGNHKSAYDALDIRNKHKVSTDLTKVLEKKYRLDFKGKKVLLIGNFNRRFVDYIEYNESEVTAVDAYEVEDFMDKFNETLEELDEKKFDIILSNPPYGKIGVEVTKRIIDEIEYEDFINILPIIEYTKKGVDIYKYVDIESISYLDQYAFSDARVQGAVVKIRKTKNRAVSEEEFRIEAMRLESIKDYFYENLKREDEILDSKYSPKYTDDMLKLTPNTTFVIHMRFTADAHNYKGIAPPTRETNSAYKWNVMKKATPQEIFRFRTSSKGDRVQFTPITFNSKEEKDNFTNFWFSEDGNAFIYMCVEEMHRSYPPMHMWMPKVDWTREWTVEELLEDYGYTPKQIQEVMKDINNFKGMNK